MNVSIERWFPSGAWAFPTGLTSTGLTVGLVVTASLLPWLTSQFGWRGSFMIMAPFGLVNEIAGLPDLSVSYCLTPQLMGRATFYALVNVSGPFSNARSALAREVV